MKKCIRSFLAGVLYVFCNYFVTYIPSWIIRKALYRMMGMKIGKHSRIMMRTIVTIPWRITIGDNTIVNEYCYLDGRGRLTIGNNVNISIQSMLVTGTHNHKSTNFDYYHEPIIVADDVWLGARATILNGCTLNKGCIISAGSVVSPRTICEEYTIYCGVPASKVKDRGYTDGLQIEPWTVFFR